MNRLAPLFLMALCACQPDKDDQDDTADPSTVTDADADGYDSDEDCDDGDPAIHPGAAEGCDGVDNDCDGEVDEDVGTSWFADADGDGYGDPGVGTVACEAPSGWVADGADCDDTDDGVNPGADELCNGEDDDCDGEVDEDDAVDALTWYEDGDDDGYGSPDAASTSCGQPTGHVADAGDCDDNDDDIHPGADELCNGEDDDCDGTVDEDAADGSVWYEDGDEDGYGDPDSATTACSPPSGWVADSSDCDDNDDDVHPGAAEVCNGEDDDCDGVVDGSDATGSVTWYADTDADGYGDPDSPSIACEQPSGHVADATDCDDGDAAVSPSASELCDGVDNDCDGAVDEDDAVGASTWYADDDDDGFGDPGSTTTACSQPSEYVSDDSDCDDNDDDVHPGAVEVCNGEDDDCDGTVDGDGAADAATWYVDRDSDGYGDAAISDIDCDQPSGWVANATDCDDFDAGVNPAATEQCDGDDNDCDGLIDDDDVSVVGASTWYADSDGDGYGDLSRTTTACGAASGWVSDTSDCDDTDSAIHPAASELCDGVDNDCDGTTDEDSASDAASWYTDADGDGYGDPTTEVLACDTPSGMISDGSDCDDAVPSINPGSAEVCGTGVDEDCDGSIDEDGAFGQSELCPAASCEDILAGTSASDGVYWIDPTGSSPYEVWCDMTNEDGGWTLLGVLTNGDGSSHWNSSGTGWVTGATFGDPTSPSTNADAKSQAFSDLPIDEIMVVHYPSTVGVVSGTGCLGGNTLLNVFQRSSSSSASCAWSCSTVYRSSTWSQSLTDTTLRFRCMDTDGTTTDGAGYTIATDDNSAITTLQNGSYRDNNFGLGAGCCGSSVDWDRTSSDSSDSGDTTQVLLLGR